MMTHNQQHVVVMSPITKDTGGWCGSTGIRTVNKSAIIRRFVIAVATTILFACDSGGSGGAVAILGVLSQVNTVLQQQESTLNTAAGDKVHQLSIEIGTLMKNAENYGKDFNNATTEQREAFVAQATSLLQQASRLTESVGSEISGNVNKVLVSAASTMQAIPFTKPIKPFVLGTDPLSVTDLNQPVNIRAYAFIPPHFKPEDTVVQINDVELPTKLFSDNRIGFQIPANVLKYDRVNTYDIVFTDRHWLWKDDIIKISGDIQVDNPEPWKCNIIFSSKNPDAKKQVTGKPIDITADSSHSTVDRSISAEEFFSLMGADASKFDAKSAKILSISESIASASKPCACGVDPSARVVSFTEDAVHVNLTAPDTPYGRVCSGDSVFDKYVCGGGGSNITLRLNPIIVVDVISEPKTKIAGQQHLVASRKTSTSVQAAIANWVQISTTCAYQNGPLAFSDHVTLDQEHSHANSDLNYLELTKDAAGIFLATRF